MPFPWRGGRASYDYSPACWSWAPPTEADRERVRGRYAYLVEAMGEGDPLKRTLAGLVMVDWQQDRCAACASKTEVLVEDHDHLTGLVRGYLCRGCNTAEGMNGDGARVWREYRERNPASICGIREFYYNWYTKEHARPPSPMS
jgi:hypothetical protein